jgi:hypothetical protein
MNYALVLFKDQKKIFGGPIIQGSCGCPIRPLLGEAVYHGEDRYIVVDVSWNFGDNMCYISALYQEPEDEDEALHPALQEGARENSVSTPAGEVPGIHGAGTGEAEEGPHYFFSFQELLDGNLGKK